MKAGEPLLRFEDVCVDYGSRRTKVRVVDHVSFEVQRGETVGLVGESGAGKSTIARAILGLVPITSGRILFEGEDITHAPAARRRTLSRDLQVVFQDPYGSLNPARTIGQTLGEPLSVHDRPRSSERAARVAAMVERVGLARDSPQRYPREFSGGQRQRIAIARALMLSPKLLICDEPVSALDVSIQGQVLNLLRELQAHLDLSYLFIAHDLAIVYRLADNIVVLNSGRVMERGSAEVVYRQPAHPYTRTLLEAAPVADEREQARRRRLRVSTLGRVVDADLDIGQGCPFQARCRFAAEECRQEQTLRQLPYGSYVSCDRYEKTVPVAQARLWRSSPR